jgi:hypothetical protein
MRIGRVRLTLIVGILALVVLGVAAWFGVLSPRLSEASKQSAQAEQLQTANLALLNQYNKSLDLAERAPQAAADAQALFETMPEQADLPLVLDQITNAATSAGIDPNAVTSITTSVPRALVADATEAGGDTTGDGASAASTSGTAGINLAQMEIGVTAEGTRAQTLGFLDLQHLDRATLVTSTQLADVPAVDGQQTDNENILVGGSMFVLQSRLPDLVAKVEVLLAEAGQSAPSS